MPVPFIGVTVMGLTAGVPVGVGLSRLISLARTLPLTIGVPVIALFRPPASVTLLPSPSAMTASLTGAMVTVTGIFKVVV